MPSNFLIQSERALLSRWMHDLKRFISLGGGSTPYMVGSALTTPDYRDVDIRTIVDDDTYEALAAIVDLERLHLAVSTWGQKVTGLPIDWQVQSRTESSGHTGLRDPIGIHYEVSLRRDTTAEVPA